MNQYNQEIIDNLDILARYYKKVGDQWRQQAYQRAIVSIKGLDFQITDIKQIKSVKGIGKNINEKINEYLNTGEIHKVEEVKGQLKRKANLDSKSNILEEFQEIWGVGPAKAAELYADGMRSINDVRNNKQLLNANQRIGLKYYEELLKSIPRYYIDIFQMVLRVAIGKTYGLNSFRLEIAGSYRRGALSSGDIDCLITSKKFNLQQLVNTLIKWNIITDILSVRDEKFMGIVHCPNGDFHHFRMDIEFIPENEWGACLLYFTGSKGFNVSTRIQAKKMGYTLNQHGLFDSKGHRIPVYTEKEILNAIGMNYVPPEKR